MARAYAIPHVHTDWSQQVAAGDIDALALVTPDDTDAAIATAAMKAGLNVWCEKPLASDARQAWSMVGLAERTGCQSDIRQNAHETDRKPSSQPSEGRPEGLQARI